MIETTSLNKRIAKVLGWYVRNMGDDTYQLRCGAGAVPYVFKSEKTAWDELPNWSSSLDLMHELEEELSDEEWLIYHGQLAWLARGKEGVDYTKFFLHATAAQKAEAWLKVKVG